MPDFNIGMNLINQLSLMNNIPNKLQYINNFHEQNFFKNNKEKINVVFKDDYHGLLNRTLFVPVEMSVEELLKLYLKSINRNPNDDELYFFFEGKTLNNCKKNIQQLGFVNGSLVLVSEKQQVLGGP